MSQNEERFKNILKEDYLTKVWERYKNNVTPQNSQQQSTVTTSKTEMVGHSGYWSWRQTELCGEGHSAEAVSST